MEQGSSHDRLLATSACRRYSKTEIGGIPSAGFISRGQVSTGLMSASGSHAVTNLGRAGQPSRSGSGFLRRDRVSRCVTGRHRDANRGIHR